jgi:hypothetical protein
MSPWLGGTGLRTTASAFAVQLALVRDLGRATQLSRRVPRRLVRVQGVDQAATVAEMGAKSQAVRRRERPFRGSDLPLGNDEVGSNSAGPVRVDFDRSAFGARGAASKDRAAGRVWLEADNSVAASQVRGVPGRDIIVWRAMPLQFGGSTRALRESNSLGKGQKFELGCESPDLA